MMSLQLERELERTLDFMYGYLSLRAYFFVRRTGIFSSEYPNSSYAERWRSLKTEKAEKAETEMLEKAFEFVKSEADFSCLDLCDVFDRASYFALIHPNHPNITLGFVKDADLWNIWLAESPFSLAREAIGEILGIGGDKLKVADLGCGSVSPLYYGSVMGSKGIYSGIDSSHSLVRIAENKVKSERLDWVSVKKGDVETKLVAKRKYDAVICSSLLQYVKLMPVLRNAGELLDYDGTLVIFSEVFRDVEPEKEKLMSLYYELIPGFRRFPAVSEILECLDSMGVNYRYKAGRNILVIEFAGR